MNRAEHLQWCKDRAMEYVNSNDLQPAFSSFISDMSKHPDTSDHLALDLGMRLLLSGNLSTKDQMKQWVEGFN